jgi:hypothetical protein
MKEFLRDMFLEPFTEGVVGYILGLFAWIISLLLLIGLIWLFIWLIDSSFLKQQNGKGFIVEKNYIPAHTQTRFIYAGKAIVPITDYIDDSYGLTIKINGLCGYIYVTKDTFHKLNIGDSCCLKYTNGRILNRIYIKDFCK